MSADALLQAATDGAVEGGTVIAVGGIMHAIGRATSSITNAAKKAVPKGEPVKPLPDEALERVAGGAKDLGWKPNTSDAKGISPYYPTNNGAVIGTEKKIFLMPGDKIDRYGRPDGQYFAPINTPLEMRAMPCNADLTQYRQFEVVKPFEVEVSTVQPAFGGLGLGIQYRAQATAEVLLSKGIIKKIGGN